MVTINISRESYYQWNKNPFNIGKTIGIKGQKRLFLLIKNSSKELNSVTVSTKLVYKPSPKSKLKNKSIFSKIKTKIYEK